MARRKRAKLAGSWLGIAVIAELWTTRIIDYAGRAMWAQEARWFAVFATLVIGGLVTGLWKGEAKHAHGFMEAMLLFYSFSAFTYGFLFTYNSAYGNSFGAWDFPWVSQGLLISTAPTDIVFQLASVIITKYLSASIACTEEEVRIFRREARRIGARLEEAVGTAALDKLERDMKALQERASLVGYRSKELALIQEQLAAKHATITATARVRQILERDNTASVGMLRSRSGLPADKFALLLIDLCDQFALSITGSKVMFRVDPDIAEARQRHAYPIHDINDHFVM